MSALPDEQLIELLLHLQKAPPDSARAILNGQPQIAYALITLMVKMGAIDLKILAEKLDAYGVPTGPRPSAPPAVDPRFPARALPPHLAPPPLQSSSSYTNGMLPQAATVPSAAPSYSNSSAPNLTTPAAAPYQKPPAPSMYPNRVPPQASYPTGAAGTYQQGPPPPFQQQGPPPPFQQGPPNPYHQPPPPNSYQQREQYGHRGPEPDMYGGRYGGPPSSRPLPGYQAAPPPAHYQPPQPQSQIQPDILAAFPPEQKAMIAQVIAMSPDDINRLPPTERANVLQLRSTLGVP